MKHNGEGGSWPTQRNTWRITTSFFNYDSTWTGGGNSTEGPTGDLLWAMDKGHMLMLLVKLPVFVSQPNIIYSLSE